MPGVLRNDRRSATLFFLGYASITTTLDLYGHLHPGEMDRYLTAWTMPPPMPRVRPNKAN
jgi:hypothetical protein